MTAVGIEHACTELRILLDRYDWFWDCLPEKNEIVVYVQSMSMELMKRIPDHMYQYRVRWAFVQYLMCEEKYAKKHRLDETPEWLNGKH